MQSKKTKNAKALKKISKKCSKYIRDYMRIEDIRILTVAEGFEKHGLDYSEVGVSNTIGRGTFTLAYFLVLCKIFGIETIKVKDILDS